MEESIHIYNTKPWLVIYNIQLLRMVTWLQLPRLLLSTVLYCRGCVIYREIEAIFLYIHGDTYPLLDFERGVCVLYIYCIAPRVGNSLFRSFSLLLFALWLKSDRELFAHVAFYKRANRLLLFKKGWCEWFACDLSEPRAKNERLAMFKSLMSLFAQVIHNKRATMSNLLMSFFKKEPKCDIAQKNEWIALSLFRSQKRAICSKKKMSEFPTLIALFMLAIYCTVQ